jgi:alkylhydroperoxidase family enzyme
MSPRIAPQEPPYPEPVRAVIDRLTPPGVPALSLFRVLARDERLFTRFANGGLLDRGHLTLREREIVILRVTANYGSEYEWGVHVRAFAHKASFDEAQIHATRHGDAHAPCWTAKESLLIAFCDALRSSSTLDDAQYSALRAEFSEEAILELLLLHGFYRTVSTLTGVLQIPLEPWAARFPNAGSSKT